MLRLRLSLQRSYSFHYDFEDFVEFVGGEAFDVFGAGIEVAPNVGEDSEVGIDRGGVTFEDFKICVAGRQTKPNTLVICDGVSEVGLYSLLGVLVEDTHLLPLAPIVEFHILHYHVGGGVSLLYLPFCRCKS